MNKKIEIWQYLIVVPKGCKYVQIVGHKEIIKLLKMTNITPLKEIYNSAKFNMVQIDELAYKKALKKQSSNQPN